MNEDYSYGYPLEGITLTLPCTNNNENHRGDDDDLVTLLTTTTAVASTNGTFSNSDWFGMPLSKHKEEFRHHDDCQAYHSIIEAAENHSLGITRPSFHAASLLSKNNNKSAIFCGRDAEVALLHQILNQIILATPQTTKENDKENLLLTKHEPFQQNQSASVLISGPSGSGKTLLCESLVHHVVTKFDGFFVRGKHEQSSATSNNNNNNINASAGTVGGVVGIPYAALVAAFEEVCDLIRQSPNLPIYQSRIQTFFTQSQDLQDLTRLISNLSQIITTDTKDGADEVPPPPPELRMTTTSGDQQFTRFKRLCQTFLRAVAIPQHPIVLLLDDLQFADAASLQVIQALMTDEQSKHVLILGVHRLQQQAQERNHEAEEAKENSDQPRGQEEEIYTEEFRHFLNVFDDHMPTTKAKQKRQDEQPSSLLFYKIRIGNLSQHHVNRIISKSLSRPPADTQDLSHVVYNKTGGLPLAVTEFLNLLVVESFIWCTHHDDKDDDEDFKFKKDQSTTATCKKIQWNWDLDRIKAETDVSGNIVALLGKRLHRIDGLIRHVLVVAACLGHAFRFDLLAAMLFLDEKEKDRDDGNEKHSVKGKGNRGDRCDARDANDTRIRKILDRSSRLGLIEEVSRNQYKFSHDSVQSALLKFANKEGWNVPLLHCHIGKKARDILQLASSSPARDIPDQDGLVFIAADQLNRGSMFMVDDQDEMLSLIRLNQQASEKAKLKHAHHKALIYLRNAITLFDQMTARMASTAPSIWETHYDVSLKIHLMAAELEGQSGNIEECTKMFSAVLDNVRSFSDKAQAYKILIASLGAQKRLQEALDLGLDILRHQGICFPSKCASSHVLVEVIKSRIMVGRKTDEQLCNLPKMKDENLLAVMPILVATSAHALFVGNTNLYRFMSLKLFQQSLKHGLSPESVVGFQNWAMVNAFMGRRDDAYRFGKLALILVEELQASQWESRAMMIFHTYINHWKEPLHNSVKPLIDAYHSGMHHGDMFYGFMAASSAPWAIACSGGSLSRAEDFFQMVCPKMMELGQETAYLISVIMWQCVLNLQGHSVDPLLLDGEAMNEEYVVATATASKNQMALCVRTLTYLGLSGFYQDWELTMLSVKRLKSPDFDAIRRYMENHFGIDHTSFFSAMAYLAIGNIKKAKKIKRKSERWAKKGKVDLWPCVKVLEIEILCATKGNYINASAILAGFDVAIEQAIQHELWPCAAFANERAGDAMRFRGDLESAKRYFSSAQEFYAKWEAFGKVDQLTDKLKLLSEEEGPWMMEGWGLSATEYFESQTLAGDCGN